MVSASAVSQGAELELPLLLFAHRCAKDQQLDLGVTFWISTGDNMCN